jgi:hypothetical protein
LRHARHQRLTASLRIIEAGGPLQLTHLKLTGAGLS